MKNHGITVHEGTARLAGTQEVAIEPAGETLKAGNIILATGARPRPLREPLLTASG